MAKLWPLLGAIALAYLIQQQVEVSKRKRLVTLVQKAAWTYTQGDYFSCMAMLTKALHLAPNSYYLLARRGKAKLKLGWYEEALADANHSLALQADTLLNPMAHSTRQKALLMIRQVIQSR